MKPLPDFPEYSIREDGAVMRDGRMRKQQIGSTGYWEVSLRGGKNRILVHRFVARAFLGEPPTEKHTVAHNDGNRRNNRVGNLRWATVVENLADKKRHGTQVCGAQVKGSVLNEPSVREIHRRYAAGGIIQRELAAEFGVSQSQISRILCGQEWRHIKSMDAA